MVHAKWTGNCGIAVNGACHGFHGCRLQGDVRWEKHPCWYGFRWHVSGYWPCKVLKIIYGIWMRYFYGFIKNLECYPSIQGSRVLWEFSLFGDKGSVIHWVVNSRTSRIHFSQICELFSMVWEFISWAISWMNCSVI